MGGVIQAAEQVLSPVVNAVVSPIMQSISPILQGLEGGAQGGIQGLLQGFEKGFLGGFQGTQSTPGQGGFPQFPPPFQAPPYANNPYQAFGGGSDSGGISPQQVQNVGNTVGQMQQNAMALLQKPNASPEDQMMAQQMMEQANQLFSMMSKMLEQQSQMSTSAIQAIR